MKAATLAVHSGLEGPSQTGATAVPIYQTVAYQHKTAQELADIFDGRQPGYVYTRLGNPTTTALERRLIGRGRMSALKMRPDEYCSRQLGASASAASPCEPSTADSIERITGFPKTRLAGRGMFLHV